MKRFGINKGFGMRLYGVLLPKNAIYGEDTKSVWYSEKPDAHGNRVEIRRLNMKTGRWMKPRMEYNPFVCGLIRRLNLSSDKVEYCLEVGAVSSQMSQANRKRKGTALKRVSSDYGKRSTYTWRR